MAEYDNLLKYAESRCRALTAGGKTFAEISTLGQEQRKLWHDLGEKLVEFAGVSNYRDVVPIFDSFLGCGGESIVLKVREKKSGAHYVLKIANERINAPDTKEEVASWFGLVKKDAVIRVNNLRKRFTKGIESQKMLADLLAVHDFREGRVQKVFFVSQFSPVFALLEFVHGDNFFKFVRRKNIFKNDADKKLVLFIFWKIVKTILFFHRNGVIHRDVKPHNIIVDEATKTNTPVFIDFGLTKDLTDRDRGVNTIEGTILGDQYYSPPEQVFFGIPATYKSDVYSLGWFLFFLHTGENPPTHYQKRQLRIEESLRVPSCFRDLFKAATAWEIEERPDIDDFLGALEEILRREHIKFELDEEEKEPKEFTISATMASIQLSAMDEIRIEMRKMSERLFTLEAKLKDLGEIFGDK